MDPYGALGMGHDHYGGAHDAYGGTLGPEMNTLPRDMTLDAHTAMEYKYDTSSIPAPSFSPTSQHLTSGPSDVIPF